MSASKGVKMENTLIKYDVIYKDLHCKLFSDESGKYLILNNPTEWGKSHEYGFSETSFSKWCLY